MFFSPKPPIYSTNYVAGMTTGWQVMYQLFFFYRLSHGLEVFSLTFSPSDQAGCRMGVAREKHSQLHVMKRFHFVTSRVVQEPARVRGGRINGYPTNSCWNTMNCVVKKWTIYFQSSPSTMNSERVVTGQATTGGVWTKHFHPLSVIRSIILLARPWRSTKGDKGTNRTIKLSGHRGLQ